MSFSNLRSTYAYVVLCTGALAACAAPANTAEEASKEAALATPRAACEANFLKYSAGAILDDFKKTVDASFQADGAVRVPESIDVRGDIYTTELTTIVGPAVWMDGELGFKGQKGEREYWAARSLFEAMTQVPVVTESSTIIKRTSVDGLFHCRINTEFGAAWCIVDGSPAESSVVEADPTFCVH
jgi:hypothetical protein